MQTDRREIDNLITVNARDWSREIIEDDSFAYPSSRLRAREKYLLTADDFRQLIYNDRSETDWIGWWARIFNAGNYSIKGDVRETITYNFDLNDEYFRELAGESKLAHLFLLDHDYSNLKVMLSNYVLHIQRTGNSFQESSKDLAEVLQTNSELFFNGGNLKIDTLAQWLAAVLSEETAQVSIPDLFEKYMNMATEAVGLDIENEDINNLASLDRNVDKAYFRHFLDEVNNPTHKKYKETALDYISIMADSANLQSFFRSKLSNLEPSEFQAEFVSGGTIGFDQYARLYTFTIEELNEEKIFLDHQSLIGDLIDLANENDVKSFLEQFAKTRDNIIMDFSIRFLDMIYGPEVLLGFWLAKRNEAINLRMILFGRERKSDRDEILDSLRKLYRRA